MATSKPDYDQPLKWLAERDPDGFLRLILKAPPCPSKRLLI